MENLGGVRMRRSITKLRRDVKALSPIFAVLILIAITVIAGIIVFMFTSGYLGTMMGGGTAGQEKVAIEAVECPNNSTLYAWSKSTGGGDVIILEAILKDSAGNVVEVDQAVVNGLLLADGTLTAVTCSFTMTSGNLYTVSLVSKEGNQYVSPTFKAP
jgi:flagellin-like protein